MATLLPSVQGSGENQPKLTGSMNKCYTHICGPGQDVVRWLI